MIEHQSKNQSCLSMSAEPLVKLWLLRLLVHLGGYRELVEHGRIDNNAVPEALGLAHWLDPKTFDCDPYVVRNELDELYKSNEKELKASNVVGYLAVNIKRLSTLVGLSKVDCRILEFVVLIHNETILDDTADYLGQLSSKKVFRVLSVILGIPEHKIRRSLSTNSILFKSGLVTVSRNGADSLQRKLDLLSSNFADNIYSSDSDPITLLRDVVFTSSPPHLKLDDYQHLKKEIDILRPYLRKSVEAKRIGVNAFLYGNPGTGKTELVKVLANELGYELFEVASEDEDGDPISGTQRLRAFRAAQNFLKNRKVIILFDEVEDVFADGHWAKKSTAQTHKAWINRMLEENQIPTLWLSNSVEELDPAFVRRFDMFFELPVPPKKQRQQIIRKTCSSFLDNQAIDRIAESEKLSPAIVNRAASVVQSIQDELDQDGAASAFELIVNNTLETQGHKRIRKNDPNRLPNTYDPQCINADSNISEIAEGLKQTKSGRICIYGPPGTGKTAYGRWLAEQLEIPLLVKRGSDLISKWVGGTEKNIANAFKEAESEGALLLIDEVEGFLQDRRGAQKSWEVTAVNEMLTQMESFTGVFMASTNLLDSLDQAALRRFDLKMKFDFLLPDQSWRLLKSYCNELNLTSPKSELKHSLDRLQHITPGDFAAIMRRHRFKPIKSAQELVSALDDECKLKNGSKQAIRFV